MLLEARPLEEVAAEEGMVRAVDGGLLASDGGELRLPLAASGAARRRGAGRGSAGRAKWARDEACKRAVEDSFGCGDAVERRVEE